MITLYDASETQFAKNGLGSLPDALSCTVTEERNGQYELEMTYPRSGRHWGDIKRQRIIYAKPTPYSDPQPFPIYKITKDIKGTSKIYAEHISYRLSKIPVSPFTATTCAQALSALKTNAAEACPFNFSTDKQISSNFEITVPKSIRQVLGGSDDSILEKFKGEYEFDKFDVKLWTNRGADRGVKIRYGKNMTDFEQEESIENTYTGIYPYWTGTVGEGIPLTITLPEKVLYSENADLYPHRMTIPVDLTSRFSDLEGPPTEEQLRREAINYINANNIGVPKVSMDVSFVALRQTQEYQNVAPLERVHLCDTVTVEFEKLNVEATAKVIKTVYNVLTDRYDSITIGDVRSNLASTISNQNGEIKKSAEDVTSAYQKKIVEATNILKGTFGGHVVMGTDADGHPNEIFIMDTDDISTAVNIIRMNYQGIGFSTHGIEGPYSSAWLIDGTFDASEINVINLSANLLQTGIITDKTGRNYWNLDTGEISIQATDVDVGIGGRNYIRRSNTMDFAEYYFAIPFFFNDAEAMLNNDDMIVNPGDGYSFDHTFKIASFNMAREYPTYKAQDEAGIRQQIANYNSFLSKYNPDVMCAQEAGGETFDTAGNFNMNTYVFNSKFSYNSNPVNNNKVWSKTALTFVKNHYFVNIISGKPRVFTEHTITFEGKTLHIFNAHCEYEGDFSEVRQGQFEEIAKEMRKYTYSICCGDFNNAAPEEWDLFKQYSFGMANNGGHGLFKTWDLNNIDPSWPNKALDNVIVTPRIKVLDVKVGPYDFDHFSDHAPLVAVLKFD